MTCEASRKAQDERRAETRGLGKYHTSYAALVSITTRPIKNRRSMVAAESHRAADVHSHHRRRDGVVGREDAADG
jgi:hypothetical protein